MLKYLRIVICILLYAAYRLFLMPTLSMSLNQPTSELHALPSAIRPDVSSVYVSNAFQHRYSELGTNDGSSPPQALESTSKSGDNGRTSRRSDRLSPVLELIASNTVHTSVNHANSATTRNTSVEAVGSPTANARNGITRTRDLLSEQPGRLSIVTAADGGHFLTLVGALWALRRTEAESTRIIIYDLGLKPCQRRYLDGLVSCFPRGTTVVKSFDYSRYPSYFNVNQSAGCYAWKPAIVHEVLTEVSEGDSVVWVDAGTEMGRRVDALLADSHSYSVDGFISTVTTGTMDQWTHQGMKDWFAEHTTSLPVAATIKRERAASPCNGAFLGFRKGSEAEQAIVPTWLACAMDINCIAPVGSSRRNHRQDQSALTLLVKLHLHPGRGCTPLRADGSMRFWRDIYYEVNAPIVFQGYSKSSCSDAKHEDWLVCRSAKRRATELTEHVHSTVAVVVVFSNQNSIEEREVQSALAALRRLFWRAADLHVFLALGPKCSSVQLTSLEQLVGMDSTVSVLSRPSNEVMRHVIDRFEGVVVASAADLTCFAATTSVGCESLRSLPSQGIERLSVGECSVVGSSDLGAVAVFLTSALNGNEEVMASSTKSGIRHACLNPPSGSSAYRTPHVAVRNPPIDDRPLLVAEAVSSDKQVITQGLLYLQIIPHSSLNSSYDFCIIPILKLCHRTKSACGS